MEVILVIDSKVYIYIHVTTRDYLYHLVTHGHVNTDKIRNVPAH